jgi:hypothetical protein
MDFNQLMSKMRELDQPAVESAVAECGDPMSMPPSPMSPPGQQMQPPPAHPSMSVNLNAQGMDNIESLMKLITKVNPDMINQPNGGLPPMPSLTPPGATITSIKPELPPLKMLPDFDKEEPPEMKFGGPSGIDAPDGADMDMDGPDMDGDNDNKPGGEMDSDYNDDGKLDPHEKDHAAEKPLLKTLDLDKDGDHDMDDHDMEKDSADGDDSDDEEKKKEAWDNEPDESEKSIDYMNNQLAGGMNRPKATFPKVAGGDNPMQRVKEGGDLRAQIRAELLQRLAEAKGAK